jgi:3,4-dihydroxy 2-butanone 4-phosphate synthase/GTP cyclohydrolase II
MNIEPVPGDEAETDSDEITPIVATKLPTRHGVFGLLGYALPPGGDHLVLTRGLDVATAQRATGRAENMQAPNTADERVPATVAGDPPLVRLHSECLTGDALGSWRCDCGAQLDAALQAIADTQVGVLIYARGHEGRGIGLLNKLRAYALQDTGLDTVEANLQLGFPVDTRDYGPSAHILHALGLERIRLLSSNPAKQATLEQHGISVVERIPLNVGERPENAGYLQAKRTRMGHDADAGHEWAMLRDGVVPASRPPSELVERYGPLVTAGEPLVIGQLGQSADGFIASRTGDSRNVTGEGDREHLHRLRALVDAVVVGAGTVSADDCQLTVRAVPGTNPVRVVVDPHARIPLNSCLLTDGAAPTIWLVGRDAAIPSGVGTHVRPYRLHTADDFALDEILESLTALGLRRVLVEGGGRTVSRFLHAGALDRLFLTTAPILIGDGIPGIRFDGTDALSGASTGRVRRFIFGADVCTEFDFATADGSAMRSRPTAVGESDGHGAGRRAADPVSTGAVRPRRYSSSSPRSR